MWVQRIITPILITVLAVFVWTCGNQITEPVSGQRIVLRNDEAQLQAQVTYFEDRELALTRKPPNDAEILSLTRAHSAGTISIMLRAEVAAPTVAGHAVHAGHVTFNNKHAYVAYHTKDDTYRGAVDIIDIQQIKRPRLRSRALFRDTDITIAAQEEGKLFLGEATDSDRNRDFDTPACLEIVELRNQKLTDRTTRIDLPSFNGNDIACFDDAIFVTTGTTDGYLVVVPNHGTSVSTRISIPEAKAIDKTRDYILVLSGTGVRLHLLDRSTLAFVKTIDLGCQNKFKAKAEMDVVDDIVYISAGTCGLLKVDLRTEAVSVALQAPPDGSINGVSVSDGLVFLANGSAGLQVVEITLAGLVVIGAVSFDGGSTNFVGANDDVLFIANGSGGFKICEIVR